MFLCRVKIIQYMTSFFNVTEMFCEGSRVVQSECLQRISGPGSQNKSSCEDGQANEHEALRVRNRVLELFLEQFVAVNVNLSI